MKNGKIIPLAMIYISLLFQLINSESSIVVISSRDNLYETLRNLQNSCNTDTCIPGQGYCKADKCVCLEGFMSVEDKNNKLCNYKQKNVMISLLLEAFGLVGFGHLYAGRMFAGILKLICFYVIICYGSQFVIAFMKENTDTETAYYIKLLISFACLAVPLLWHCFDLYKWANNEYLDGNGHMMMDW